jgi:hypothetical protein
MATGSSGVKSHEFKPSSEDDGLNWIAASLSLWPLSILARLVGENDDNSICKYPFICFLKSRLQEFIKVTSIVVVAANALDRLTVRTPAYHSAVGCPLS